MGEEIVKKDEHGGDGNQCNGWPNYLPFERNNNSYDGTQRIQPIFI